MNAEDPSSEIKSHRPQRTGNKGAHTAAGQAFAILAVLGVAAAWGHECRRALKMNKNNRSSHEVTSHSRHVSQNRVLG